nr:MULTISPECIES: endo-1,4-beta-xylanase [Myxococcaceae]
MLVALDSHAAERQQPVELIADGDFHATLLSPWRYRRVSSNFGDRSDSPTGSSLLLRSAPAPDDPTWAWGIRQLLQGSIEEKDVIVFRAWMRSQDRVRVLVVMEDSKEPYRKELRRLLRLSPEWKEYTLVLKASRAFAKGDAQLNIQLGLDRGTAEIATVRLENYSRDPHPVPRENVDPFGGEANPGDWRPAALSRIERIRKGELNVRVLDRRGKPVPGASVELKQLRHRFHFGTAVVARRLLGSDPDSVRYRAEIERLFNTIVFENEMKWERASPAQLAEVQQAVAWARKRGFDIRGHTLVWGDYAHSPGVRGLSKEQGRQRVEQRVQGAVAAMKGQVYIWDVVNEAVGSTELWEDLGWSLFPETFRIARRADPAAQLCYNEANLANQSLGERPLAVATERVRALIASGAPLDVIGDQAHMSLPLTPIRSVLSIWDGLASFQRPLEVTEFDVAVEDDLLHASYVRDFLTAAFSHPALQGFTLWGFWEGQHWLATKGGAMFRRDWSKRPAQDAYEQLVLGAWWSREHRSTAADGVARMRVFYGTHELVVVHGRARERRVVTLEPGKDGTFEFRL